MRPVCFRCAMIAYRKGQLGAYPITWYNNRRQSSTPGCQFCQNLACKKNRTIESKSLRLFRLLFLQLIMRKEITKLNERPQARKYCEIIS